jgi:polar amino acid transport system permease protein
VTGSTGVRTRDEISSEELPVVPLRHGGRWVAAAAIAVVVVWVVGSMVSNERFQWDVVGEFLFSEQILRGLLNTILLTAVSMALAIVLGTVVAIGRMSENPVVARGAWVYAWIFRGTPAIVQLLFWFFLAALVPVLGFGVPFGPTFFQVDTNSVISAFTAAILGLGLNEAAYMSEIVRSGLLSVPAGQREAAKAIGMTSGQSMRRVVLPQALRIIVPPTGNEIIGMLKTSSLVIVIGFSELMTSASQIYSRNYQTIPLLVVAAVWYLVLTAVLSVGQFYLERRLGRGLRAGVGARPAPVMEVAK